MKYHNINDGFGDPVDFDSLEEFEEVLRQMEKDMPCEDYNGSFISRIPEDGLREGRDYIIIYEIDDIINDLWNYECVGARPEYAERQSIEESKGVI